MRSQTSAPLIILSSVYSTSGMKNIVLLENLLTWNDLSLEWDFVPCYLHEFTFFIQKEQANSKNCGPPPGNKFVLEIGQRSRSSHGTNRKGLSQEWCMPNINALSLILQKIWARLKFVWQTDGQMDEWDLMSPRFRESGGQKRRSDLTLSYDKCP